MTTADIRRGGLDIRASAGLTETVTVTWLDQAGDPLTDITASSLWLGGTTVDQDDFTGADEIAGDVVDNVVTFTLPVPDDLDRVRLRMDVDGELATVGGLFPSGIGSESLTDITVRLGGASVTVETVGPPGGGGGVTVHNNLTGRDTADAHPMSAITGLVDGLTALGEGLAGVGAALGDKAEQSEVDALTAVVQANETALDALTTVVGTKAAAQDLIDLTVVVTGLALRPTLIVQRSHDGDDSTDWLDGSGLAASADLDGLAMTWPSACYAFNQATTAKNGMWILAGDPTTVPPVQITNADSISGIPVSGMAEGVPVWVGNGVRRGCTRWTTQANGLEGVDLRPDAVSIRALTDYGSAGIPDGSLDAADGRVIVADDTAQRGYRWRELDTDDVSGLGTAATTARSYRKTKTGSTPRNSDVLTADPDLAQAVPAGSYVVRVGLPHNAGNNTPDIKVALTGGTATFDVWGAATSVTTFPASPAIHLGHSTGTAVAAGSGAGGSYVQILGTCVLASPGTIQVEWAQNVDTSAQNTSVLSGAFLTIDPV